MNGSLERREADKKTVSMSETRNSRITDPELV